MSAPLSSPAIVLRHVDFRESDRVVVLLTRDFGRISGLARGVRRSVKRFAGRLDLFSEVELHFREGRGELCNLEDGTLVSAHLGIRDDLYHIAWASYFSELVERLYGVGEPHPEAYELLASALNYLSHPGAQAAVLRGYELRLLVEAGLQPELEHCVSCRRSVLGELRACFVVTRGGVQCEHCIPIEPERVLPQESLRFLTAAIRKPPEQLKTLHCSERAAKGIRELMMDFTRHHVGGSLRSATFLAGLELS